MLTFDHKSSSTQCRAVSPPIHSPSCPGRRRALTGALAALVLTLAHAGAEARRLALVIGNDHYQSVSPLQNARADARTVARALERTGFTVTLKEDLTLKSMKEALRGFKEQISGGDEAVFYFSGHGVQFEGTNYLIPTDLVPQNAEQVADESVPLQRVLDDLRDQRTRFALAIIDACRDNPFKGAGRALGGRGLAPVTAATGQMVLYSAGAGQEALDRLGPSDPDPNGVFTRVLIREIEKPGVPAEQILKNVRDQVVALARGVNHEQVPALYDQSIGEFYFVPAESVAAAAPRSAPAGEAPATRPGGAGLESYALLGSTRSLEGREKIEQRLFEQLRQALPKVVLFSIARPAEGAKPDAPRTVWGFKSASATSDARTAALTETRGELKEGHIAYDDSETWDYRLDCTRLEFVPLRHFSAGSIEYLSEARRKATTYTVREGSGELIMAQALCEAPLRISPLWAVQDIEWTDLGQGWQAALRILWSDPKHPNERWVFSRVPLTRPNEDGSDVDYWWLGINCATHESRDTPSFTGTRSGGLIGLIAGTAWEKLPESSPRTNAYVLLCERP